MTVHSAVSGRPLQTVVDHRGAGEGTALFEDDPRLYNLMVESAHVEWSFTVEDLIAVDSACSAPPVPPFHDAAFPPGVALRVFCAYTDGKRTGCRVGSEDLAPRGTIPSRARQSPGASRTSP